MEALLLYTESLKSKHTKQTYLKMIKGFMKRYSFSKMEDIIALDQKVATELIIKHITVRKEEVSYQTVYIEYCALKHLFEINDITLNWQKMKRFLPEPERTVKDRPYTHQEIKKILDKCDERKRVIILTLASTGIRRGALPALRLKHLKKLDDYNIYRFIVYENTKEEYITFCTPECAQAIDSYLEYRRNYGEKLRPESPLIRDQFDKDDPIKSAYAKTLSLEGLQHLLFILLQDSGLRQRPTESMKHKRHDIMMAHGFRKFFDTNLTKATKNPLLTEILLGHNIGLKGSYYKPSMEDLLQAYLQGVDALTINEENRLKVKLDSVTKERDAYKETYVNEIENVRAMLKEWKAGKMSNRY